MRKSVLVAGMLMSIFAAKAEERENDTLRSVKLSGVEIIATRASETTPIAFTNVTKEDIQKTNFGQDMSYLLSMTPSVVTTSDAGAGIGYTSMRVRGVDPTRINVTVNGIPVNDAESHIVFWVNLPDFASSVNDIQIQRGAGTSTNGMGAFGASVNLLTGVSPMLPYAECHGSYGSFNTHKATLKVGTGLLGNHWYLNLRLSDISTDGYIDRASAALQSYYLQAGYFADQTSVKLITFTGREKTYHAWNYASKEEMAEYGRTYNSCGYMFTDADGKPHFYFNQTDNYVQQNWQLIANHRFTSNWHLNAALHYTKGDGYYQEYKDNRRLIEYQLMPFSLDGDTVKHSDLVRTMELDNDFFGGVFALTYKDATVNATLGGALNKFINNHFGRVLWVKNYVGNLNADHEYYRNKGEKTDGNIYAKADYVISKGLNAYVDLQYRHINYKIAGLHDKWNALTDAQQELAISETFDFFNPKAGLSWRINRNNRLFGSVSVAQKEPTRNNYTNGKLNDHPKAERMIDYEMGYTYANEWLHLGANLYYMDYQDQLVLTGELNEIGEPMADNIADSYRMGLELMGSMKLHCGLSWDINATLSRNRVKDFTEVLYDDNTGEKWELRRGNTNLSFSPDIIINNSIGYSTKAFHAALQTQYVGRQYMSNADCDAHLLDAYFVSNLSLSYTFDRSLLKSIIPGVKSITLGCSVYNLFNEEYENNGYAGSGYYTDNGERIRYDYSGYAAQAGTNILANVSILF